ncbi:ATP-binding protein [Flavobacterium sp. FZUC8N2.13]|uniref:ATP-binding protein n=1 Tax=Flavobacterium zubiriense TaxID=3138075 RepID=A0ABV4TBQ3_9FLAO
MMKKLNNDLISESVLKIGSVNEVRGNKIIIKVDKEKNAPHLIYEGEIIKNVSVGSYVKITKGFNEIIGKIEGEYISDDKNLSQTEYKNFKDKIKRFLNVTLVGFIDRESDKDDVVVKFKQGLKELPLIENDCFLLTQDEFEMIHSFAKEGADLITIGTLLNETSVSIKLSVDKLFASHIGIFGNTGSGKSYTLAKLYHELINKYSKSSKFQNNAKFLLIDFNGEYAVNKKDETIIIDKEYKDRYFLSTSKLDGDRFPIPESEVNDLTFWSILLKATEQTQKPFLDSSLSKKYLIEYTKTEDGLKNLIFNNLALILTQGSKNLEKDFHVYFLDELLKVNTTECVIFSNLKEIRNRIRANLIINYGQNIFFGIDNSKEPQKFTDNLKSVVFELEIHVEKISIFSKIRLQIIFNYFYVILKGFYSREHIGPLYNRVETKFNQITKVFKIDSEDIINNKKPLTIISLNDVNVEMKKIIPLVVCKYYYEYFKKNNLSRDKYLNIIIDEAHNILSRNSIRESENWKDYRLETFEEIIKEGRKFGVFLSLSSQRPSDISDTIISQLHNYFLHRLINNKDIEAIGRTVSYLDKVSFDSLSILPQGACILAGLSADLPVVIKVDKINEGYEPYNETIVLTNNWK